GRAGAGRRPRRGGPGAPPTPAGRRAGGGPDPTRWAWAEPTSTGRRGRASMPTMDLGIEGRRAAVAAGSAGLGLGTARALVAAGVHVALCGRDQGRVEEAAASLGDLATPLVADVGTPEG